jgi:hypothetical protein
MRDPGTSITRNVPLLVRIGFFLVAMFFFVAVVACENVSKDEYLPSPIGITSRWIEIASDNWVLIWYDTERDVTCWYFRGFKAGGASCLPNHQLQ